MTARTIDISSIDHILNGQQTKRFAMARVTALSNDGDNVMKLMLDSEIMSLSLVYRVPSDSSFTLSSGISMIDGAIEKAAASKQGHHHHHHPLHHYETLDLILPKQRAYDTLLAALQDLTKLHREEKRRLARNILLLQQHWSDMGKQVTDSMTSAEWLTLCERMNIPLTKADHLRVFKNYEKQLHEGEGMLFSYVGEILEDIEAETLNDPCERIWNEVVATDPIPAVKVGRADDDASLELLNDDDEEETISAVAFLSFIRSQQKQFVWSLEDAINLINTLNNQIFWEDMDRKNQRYDVTEDTRIASFDRLGKSRFMTFLLSDFNDFFDPTAGAEDADDMTMPLSDYWIHTSHDTYRAKGTGATFGGLKRVACADATSEGDRTESFVVDEQMYLQALQRGVRCLDLDLWDGIAGEPVISRVKPTGPDNTIPLAVALRCVRGFLKDNTKSFPIILRLENHCSFFVQQKVAQQISNILGASDLLAKPDDAVSERPTLPSPASLKGKVIIMGKRPTVIEQGAKVVNDDFDDENDASADLAYPNSTFDEEERDEMTQHVVGFNSSGPITATNTSDDQQPSLDEILEGAVTEADSAKQAASLAEARAARLAFEAAEAEKLAAKLTQDAGLTAAEVKASAAAPRNEGSPSQGVEVQYNSKGTHSGPDDEGLEVQEFLHDEVKGSRNRYSTVIAEAIEASEIATSRLTVLNEADAALREAETKLYQARQREKELAEQSRRAAVEARCNHEHAESARRRVGTVRDLLRKCEETATSAKTVIVTATTEAKISERRAAEAEARAARAISNAERDRARADDETKKEERLEEECAKLHNDRTEAANASQAARERVEKAAAMLEKENEKLRIIESSDQFQRELKQNPQYPNSNMSDEDFEAFPFLQKHAAKLEGIKLIKDLIKEASNENAKADVQRRSIQEKFEDQAQMWKIQADIAAQVRKQADRSSMVAEELAEHAEEERDAATLRHVAREKAETNVQQRSSNLESVQAQLAEAERAAAEAATMLVDSRKRADALAKEAERATNYKPLIRALEECKARQDIAAEDYEASRIVKEEKDAVASDTKRLLETNAEVYTSAVRDAAAASHRANSGRVAERKAIIAYNRAILTRKQADHAKALSRIAMATSQEKSNSARQAKEYKSRSTRVNQIPLPLARLTWLHTTRHKFWDKSLSLPKNHILSIAYQAFALAHMKDPKTSKKKMTQFTRLHLCRIFPSRTSEGASSAANFDPVLPWSLGCQLVSTNLYSSDEHFLVMGGRFRQNASCGYVLKPTALTNKTSSSPSSSSTKEQRWTIRVLRGSYLPKPEARSVGDRSRCINPFVKVIVHDGESPTSQELEHMTGIVRSNGLNPVWDEKDGFKFVVTRPWVAMLSVIVYDKLENGMEDFVAGASIPIAHLRQGYRSVALYDSSHTRSGLFSFASLLVHLQKV